jgi:hypothetical protein
MEAGESNLPSGSEQEHPNQIEAAGMGKIHLETLVFLLV